jgi:hypothetical protein
MDTDFFGFFFLYSQSVTILLRADRQRSLTTPSSAFILSQATLKVRDLSSLTVAIYVPLLASSSLPEGTRTSCSGSLKQSNGNHRSYPIPTIVITLCDALFTMIKLEIKIIKGHQYLYLQDKVRVNGKNVAMTFYVGRLSKITVEAFREELAEFGKIKLKTYAESRVKKLRCSFLDQKRALKLEQLRYGYRLFEELYPDTFQRYETTVFVHYAQGTTAIEGNTITTRQAEELFEHRLAGRQIAPRGIRTRERGRARKVSGDVHRRCF